MKSVCEERITRRKNEVGYPRRAIEDCLRISGIDPSQLTEIANASLFMHRPEYLADLEPWYLLGLDGRVELRPHTAEPEAVLASAFALIRPSRDNDPWGRDVIEALSAGVPVLATGSYDGVVEPGVNGYLFDPFDAETMADRLIEFLGDPGLWNRFSSAGRAKGEKVFSGRAQVDTFTRVVERLV